MKRKDTNTVIAAGSAMDLVKSQESTEASKTNGSPKVEMSTATRIAKKLPSAACFKKGGCIRNNILTILTLFAVILGIGLGFAIRQQRAFTKREVMYIAFPGELFLRMLKGLILPLIVSSLISALGNLDSKLSGRIGARAVFYYLSTTVLAIILGIILVVSIRPGAGGSQDNLEVVKDNKPSLTVDTLLDLVRNMFPPNIIEACVQQTATELKPMENSTDLSSWDFSTRMQSGTNILGLVVFSVVLGIVLAKMNEAGRPLLEFATAMSDAMMYITRMVIWLSPIGVLFLVAGKILEMDDLGKVAGQVGLYTVTVLVGLFIHGLIVLPLLFYLFVRKSPFRFIGNMTQAIATAFGTSSSSATLPVTIDCLEKKNNIDPRVSRFCLPVGATINMDGTALYEAVAAIFIAQIRQVPLTVGNVIGISITATAASIGAAGIPQAGLVTMVMVLNVLGLPADDVALIFVVDWFLDRFRTAINVLGDAIGAGIVAHFSVADLESVDAEQPPTNLQLETTPL